MSAALQRCALGFEAHSGRKRRAGGGAEVLQAPGEVDLLVVVLQGGGSGHSLGAVLVLVFGPARRRRLRAPHQRLEHLPRLGAVS